MKTPCEGSDCGCPVHSGHAMCNNRSVVTLYRIDMEDRTGTQMCDACASDAMDSGLFTDEKRRTR